MVFPLLAYELRLQPRTSHGLLSLGLIERLEDGLFGQSLLLITMRYLFQSPILSSISLSIWIQSS